MNNDHCHAPAARLPAAALIAAALLGVAPATVLADATHRIDRVEVTSHYLNGVGTTDSASSGSITPSLIEARPLLRPGEILEYVPGVVITQHSGAGKANQYFLRGFNLDHGTDFLTTVAGIPVNMPSHGHGQGYTDLNFMIPELVDRVDYFKGPYFASKGDFSSAGAADIHYITRVAVPYADLTAGSFGYRRLFAVASPAVGKLPVLVAVELNEADGPWTNPDRFRKHNFVVRAGERSGDSRWEVTAMSYSGRWNATDQIPQRAVESGLLGRFDTLDDTDGGRSERHSLSGSFAHPVADGTLQGNAYALRYRLNLFSNFTYALDDAVNGDQFEQSDSRRILGGGLTWSRPFTLGGIDVETTVGAQFRSDRIDEVGLYATRARERLSTIRRDAVRETAAGVFAEATVKPNAWSRLQLGLRHDHYRFSVASDRDGNSGSLTAGRTSPKFGLVLGPWQKTELFANAGDGFHSNDARGTTIRIDPKTAEPANAVTPLVRTRGSEFGVKTEWVPGLQSSLALWRLALDSELVFVGDAGSTEASRPSVRRGIEWSNRYRPARWLIADLDVSLSRARFRDDAPEGRYIPGAIDRVVSAGLTWRGERGLASVFVRHFGPRPLIDDARVRSRSSTLVNAHASWDLAPKTTVRLDVFNVLDRKANDIEYYYASRLRGEAAAADDIHFHPAEGRSFRVALKVSL